MMQGWDENSHVGPLRMKLLHPEMGTSGMVSMQSSGVVASLADTGRCFRARKRSEVIDGPPFTFYCITRMNWVQIIVFRPCSLCPISTIYW